MPQILKDDLRKRILEAAGSIFAERGFEAARIADIAEQAGTSASNVYKYVKDKTDLFDKVLPAPLVAEHRRLLSAASANSKTAATGVPLMPAAPPGPAICLPSGLRTATPPPS